MADNKLNFLMMLGIAAAAGGAVGVLSARKHPLRGGLLGAAAGAVAGSVATKLYREIAADERFAYYSSSEMPDLYEEITAI